MGNFTRDTFKKLKHYVSVRLQQGVPIVDADWNEMEDIRKYELQTFLKWFVGDGVPAGNDGFRILAADLENDFQIKGGNGSEEGVARCLVDGWDVINENTINYTDQALFDNPALAGVWEVDPLPPLVTPANNSTDTIYLDVWEREVDSLEDSDHLIDPAIGIETCVRIKREWVVRVAVSTQEVPPAPEGHVHLELARLTRRSGVAAIEATDIEDLRLTGLKMSSFKDVQQIMADAYGSTYNLDNDGQPNLKLSLREAINAILRGGLPSTETENLAAVGKRNEIIASIEDRDGVIWAFWRFSETSPPETFEIRHIRFNPASGTWDKPVIVATNASSEEFPDVIEDRDGDFWLFWRTAQGNDDVVLYNRYLRAKESWQGERPLAQTSGVDNREPAAVADRVGDVWTFWTSDRKGDMIYYRRFRRATGNWDDEVLLIKEEGNDEQPFALEDINGDIWLFWTSESGRPGTNIWCKRYSRQTDSWDGESIQITDDPGINERAFALEDTTGDIWTFWISDRTGFHNIWYKRYRRADDVWEGDAHQLIMDVQSQIEDFVAFKDSSGVIWVFWYHAAGANRQIYYKRHVPGGDWSRAFALTAGEEDDRQPFALEDTSGNIWVFWTRMPSTLRFRKLIPTI